jgi:large subunit ribosomal protein L10
MKRTDIRPEKIQEVEKLASLINKYPVVGILNLHKLPARALQKIKKDLGENVSIKVTKKSFILFALEKTNKKGLKEAVTVQPALVFTEMNPFKIYNLIRKSKSPASAKVGDIAVNDIEVKAGPTDIPPGPAISTLQKIKIPAKVEGGKIAIMRDKVVCEAGGEINEDLVAALNLLKIEPMEIGLNIEAIFESGMIYKPDVLTIDEEKTLSDILSAHNHAINLSTESGFLTNETVSIMITKAFMNAKTLAIEANILEKGIIEELLAKAKAQADVLKQKVGD